MKRRDAAVLVLFGLVFLVVALIHIPPNFDRSKSLVDCNNPPEMMGRVKRERCSLVELKRIADALEEIAGSGRLRCGTADRGVSSYEAPPPPAAGR